MIPFCSTSFTQCFVDTSTISRKIGQGVKNLSLSYDCINQVRISIKLVLDDVVEHFKKKEDKMMVRRG